MSFYPLETMRAAHEEIERSERLAGAALREREMQQLRARARKRASASRVWDGSQMRDLAENTTGGVESDPSRIALFARHVPVEDVSAEPESLVETQRDGEELARRLVDVAVVRSAILDSKYDEDEFDLEKKLLSGNDSADETISTFYLRLRDVKDAFRQSSGAANPSVSLGFSADRALIESLGPRSHFSGEEAFGKYLDLHGNFHTFRNLKGLDGKLDYVSYVSRLTESQELPDEVRRKPEYRRYCANLLQYLLDFSARAFPLRIVDEELRGVQFKVAQEMEQKSKEFVDASKYSSPEDMAQTESADSLKAALRSIGLKCSGRPIDRAKRLFAVFGGGTDARAALHKHFEGPILEEQIKFLCDEVLSDQLKNTKLNAEKKLTLSYAELAAERLAEQDPAAATGEAMMIDGDDSDEEKPIYNPKDVPLGWDGKPIPYWQYKLHGLNHEFKCEVCGNATYRGPRAFERHFTEARHSYGLRCLGVQYSKPFYMVTKIAEVQMLQAKLASQSKVEFDPREDAEHEDAKGNVFNSKTYLDLARQGLL